MTDSGNANQQTLDGEVIEDDDDENSKTKDDGTDKAWFETCGGFNRYEVMSAFQKGVRRSDVEVSMFCAWELCRSGFGSVYWSRAKTTLVEDLMLGYDSAHVPAAIYNLEQLAKNKFEMDSRMGCGAAMKAARIMAEAPSSHEVLHMAEYWEGIAPERLEAINNDEEPEHDFPVNHDEWGDKSYQILDLHTRRGKAKYGRDLAHFWVESSRTSEMTPIERTYKERLMRNNEAGYPWRDVEDNDAMDGPYEFSEAEIEHALTSTDRDDPWKGDGDPEQTRLNDAG